jgi:hypothetical protein
VHIDAVTAMRHLFQRTMEDDFRAAVERLTGQAPARQAVSTASAVRMTPIAAAGRRRSVRGR